MDPQLPHCILMNLRVKALLESASRLKEFIKCSTVLDYWFTGVINNMNSIIVCFWLYRLSARTIQTNSKTQTVDRRLNESRQESAVFTGRLWWYVRALVIFSFILFCPLYFVIFLYSMTHSLSPSGVTASSLFSPCLTLVHSKFNNTQIHQHSLHRPGRLTRVLRRAALHFGHELLLLHPPVLEPDGDLPLG